MAHASDRNIAAKPCLACGRPITWRKKWERDWDAVKFCGDACRKRGVSTGDPLEAAILFLLSRRAADATICPSEVARMIAPDGWRSQMEPIREAGRRLARQGKILITQNGCDVGVAPAKGPIRFAHAPKRHPP